MTKQEYLAELNTHLMSLSSEEREKMLSDFMKNILKMRELKMSRQLLTNSESLMLLQKA